MQSHKLLLFGLVALGGALGALARYAAYEALQSMGPPAVPWGTVFVNLTGSFAFGVLLALGTTRLPLTEEWRALAFIGFLGAYTTFSTFAFETGSFLRQGYYALAAGNFVAQNALGVLCFLGGHALGQRL